MSSGIFVIDKPQGFTSHDVVAKMRRILRERRIGHSGTLDPMATGVLPVFVGRATRAVEFAQNDVKEYIARIRLGVRTDTMDITGTVLETAEADFTDAQLESALDGFRGEIHQIPPMYSAVKIGGSKLYELARKGIEVPRQPRSVTVYELERLGDTPSPGEFYMRVLCSKGTYIRTLCDDIGRVLGCGGVLSELRRTRCGGFTIKDAVTLEQLEQLEQSELSGGAFELAYGVDHIFMDYPRITVDGYCERLLKNGAAFPVSDAGVEGTYRVYGQDGEFLMLGSAETRTGGLFMATLKSFYEV